MGRGASKRGVGIQFGPDVTTTFCYKNSICMFCISLEGRGLVIIREGRGLYIITEGEGLYVIGKRRDL